MLAKCHSAIYHLDHQSVPSTLSDPVSSQYIVRFSEKIDAKYDVT